MDSSNVPFQKGLRLMALISLAKCRTPSRMPWNNGFFSESVAGQQQLSAVRVIQCEGEHAVQPFDRPRPEGTVGMENHLGIGRRPKDVSPRFQFGPQCSVIVDFAVEDDPQAIVVGHRLGAARQIDDGQAAMTEGTWSSAK